MATKKVRGFKFVDGSWVFTPGGVMQKVIEHHEVPSDSPVLKELANVYGVPVAEIRKAFGTLPAALAVEEPAPEPAPPPAPEPAAEEEPVEEAPAEEPAAPAPKKKKKKQKAAEE